MVPTIDDIFNSLKRNLSYSNYNIEKSGNQITVYVNISVKKKNERKEKLLNIRDYLKKDFKDAYNQNLIVYDPRGGGSTIGTVEIFRDNQKSLIVRVKPSKEPQFLKTWRLNEEMFADITSEYIDYAEEDESKLSLIITDGTKKVKIRNVTDAVRVGGQNKKPDIKITTTNQSYNISLKMVDFASWHSYANNDLDVSKDAIKILDNLPNITAAFGPGSSGVSVMSTIPEVKKFCYGGETDRVDYIISTNIAPKDFSYDSETHTLTLTVSKMYERNIIDYESIRKDCFLMITKSMGFSIGNKYRGYKITFVPKKIANNTLPGKR